MKLSCGDVRQCLKWAHKVTSGDNMGRGDFKRHDLPRTHVKRILDLAHGKLAEMAFVERLNERTGLNFSVDFRIYKTSNQTDYGQDILSDSELALRIDIKATRPSSQWLLVERTKFHSNIYALVKVDLDVSEIHTLGDMKALIEKDVDAEVIGYAYWFDFIDRSEGLPRHRFMAGDQLKHPESGRPMGTLKCKESFGLPISQLRRDWQGLCDQLSRAQVRAA